ncbi:MAG: hypothetical protein COB53_02345 [Elusimicrobia bacterium]|nr:MAG: hypothetical protein COB53_02345 [Elusimicrobiota bacterium]
MGFSLNINLGSKGWGASHEGSVLPETDYAPGSGNRVLIDHKDAVSVAILPMILGVVFTGISVFIFFENSYSSEWILKIIMWIFAPIGLFLFFKGVQTLILSMKFAPGRLAPSVWPLRLGQSFSMEYRRRSKADGTVDRMAARIYIVETAIYQRGTDTVTDTEEVYTQDLGYAIASQGGDQVYRGQWDVQIPGDGMASFDVSRNKVDWMVEVKMYDGEKEIDDSTFKLVVLPEIAAANEVSS